jgi:SSS family solute:Na+ symporter
MAIGSANIIVRDIWTMFAAWKDETQESSSAKWFSVLMVVFGLLFAVAIPVKDVVNFQLLGGVWITQTLPAVFLSLYFRRQLNSWGVFAGWFVGIVIGTWMVASAGFQSSVFNLPFFGITIPSYIALAAVVPNAIVAFALSPLLKSYVKGVDETVDSDYIEQPAPAAPSPLPGTPGLRPAH